MRTELAETLARLARQHQASGFAEQIDFEKFYLYSLITHSTAIEGSTVTEVEAQLLFDDGITSPKRSIVEQMMNLDLKEAYDYGMRLFRAHPKVTPALLCDLSARVMKRTGAEYHTALGDFSAARGELRLLNVTAGFGGRSYLSYAKVPARLAAFCDWLNAERERLDSADIAAVYDLSFRAHFALVTIHPWADGNGRMARLVMNLLQTEQGLLPSVVRREEKAEYIQALVDAREADDPELFSDLMARLHIAHLEEELRG